MRRFAAWLIGPAALLLLASMVAPGAETIAEPGATPMSPADATPLTFPSPEPPPPIMLSEMLADGIVIVVSKADQAMYVFEDGALWRKSSVSTGRKGHGTPSGVFAILQKKQFHRSNLYSNAPMPWMQRLTWSGIAIHAGHLPGYPASHGCIRLPGAFARELYARTGYLSTAVIVTDETLDGERGALRLAQATEAAIPIDPRLRQPKQVQLAASPMRTGIPAAEPRVRPATSSRPEIPSVAKIPGSAGQTIQLAAALSPSEATTLWQRLTRLRPELATMQVRIVPAVVNAKQYYRLRASAPGAHKLCGDLKRSGIDCFAVT